MSRPTVRYDQYGADVAIVGAGFAGLTAARELVARDRIIALAEVVSTSIRHWADGA